MTQPITPARFASLWRYITARKGMSIQHMEDAEKVLRELLQPEPGCETPNACSISAIASGRHTKVCPIYIHHHHRAELLRVIEEG